MVHFLPFEGNISLTSTYQPKNFEKEANLNKRRSTMPGDVSFSPKTQALIYAPLISTQRLWTSAVKVYCIIHKTETALFSHWWKKWICADKYWEMYCDSKTLLCHAWSMGLCLFCLVNRPHKKMTLYCESCLGGLHVVWEDVADYELR